MADDDPYGRSWDYRVFSQMWTEPDCPESGRRFLSVRRVDYKTGYLLGSMLYPLPGDIFCIEGRSATPTGSTTEEAILDGERIMQAFNKPCLIMAEWKKYVEVVA